MPEAPFWNTRFPVNPIWPVAGRTSLRATRRPLPPLSINTLPSPSRPIVSGVATLVTSSNKPCLPSTRMPLPVLSLIMFRSQVPPTWRLSVVNETKTSSKSIPSPLLKRIWLSVMSASNRASACAIKRMPSPAFPRSAATLTSALSVPIRLLRMSKSSRSRLPFCMSSRMPFCPLLPMVLPEIVTARFCPISGLTVSNWALPWRKNEIPF